MSAGRGEAAQWNLDDFDSADAAMNRCLELARLAAKTDIPVLILGETGTGKTLLANAIHNSSVRAGAPFVSFNAAALSETLMDSQLFGHEKGAFTGATRVVKGKFELADGGTLFIDEIADMPATAQVKILRAVEYGEFERLGSELLRHADVRLLSATHLPLPALISRELFRKDLFYRLNGISVTLPPLRERPNDLRALVGSKIAAFSEKLGKVVDGLDQRAAQRVFSYHWPGNLRELDRVIQAAVSLTPGRIIPNEALLIDVNPLDVAAAGAVTTPQRLRDVEQQHVRRVLQQAGGNKRKAAGILGVTRSTLDRKLAR